MASDLCKRVLLLSREWNDEAVAYICQHPDVSIAEVNLNLGSKHHVIIYRFTLPTGEDIEWDPQDGWSSPSRAMDKMAEWVAHLIEHGDGGT